MSSKVDIVAMLRIVLLVFGSFRQGINQSTNPCQGGKTFQCQDGSTPSGQPPCSSGKPQCCTSGGQCTEAPAPGGSPSPGPGGTATCSNPSCSSPPCAASLYGDIGCTTVAGTTLYSHELTSQGDTIATNAHIYGPFEAGFSAQQDSIIEGWGCSDPSQVYDTEGGLDILIAERKVAFTCNLEFPTIVGNSYKGIVGDCGGHTSDYHFHVRLSCLYSESGGHSPQVGVAGPYKLYGKWEDYANNQLPLLDACGAHFGPTPDGNVYHYHVQDAPPFTVGCYGPTADNQLVSVSACRALYTQCDQDGGSGTVISTKTGTVTYDRYCPCFDAAGSNMGTNIQELPALSSASVSYTTNTTSTKKAASAAYRRDSCVWVLLLPFLQYLL